MVGLLLVALAIGYGILYSGLSDLAGTPVSALQALWPAWAKGDAPSPASPAGSETNPAVAGGAPIATDGLRVIPVPSGPPRGGRGRGRRGR